MELDPDDKPVFEEYFLGKLPVKVMTEERYHLLLVLLGEKPGVLIMSADEEQRKLLKDLCDDMGLEMKVEKGSRRSLIDKLLRRDTRFLKDKIFVARDSERFNILEGSESGDGFSDRSIGEFLGYPEEAISFYEEHEVPGEAFKEKVRKLLDNGEVTREEVDSLDLLGYLPRPEEPRISEAVKEAEKREDVLMSLDEELDTSIGSSYLEKMETVATQS